MIALVDYGVGNVGAILNMLRKAGAKDAAVTSDPAVVGTADKVILPGVGPFDRGMANLRARGLVGPLQAQAFERRVPILGICLGMQLMGEASEEGTEKGLGWFEARSVRFRSEGPSELRVPHMGWNQVAFRKSPLAEGLADARFYFVHSYHVVADRPDDVLGTTEYGGSIVAAIERGNLFGVQFHPEKSHRYGLRLLQNFASM